MNVDDGYQFTAPVASFKPNGYGLYDMAGNVSEWCADWWDPRYYGESPTKNPSGPATDPLYLRDNSGQRVVRGGSWRSTTYSLNVADRWSRYQEVPMRLRWHDDEFGFRCVVSDQPHRHLTMPACH